MNIPPISQKLGLFRTGIIVNEQSMIAMVRGISLMIEELETMHSPELDLASNGITSAMKVLEAACDDPLMDQWGFEDKFRDLKKRHRHALIRRELDGAFYD